MSTHIQRNHVYNRSTRPLLESKSQAQPQVKKKSTKDFKVHGFNDFNFVANQYKNLNSNVGYPYSSPPPSPTTPSNADRMYEGGNRTDLLFSDDSGIHVNNISNVSTSSSTNYYEDVDSTYQLSPPAASSTGSDNGWSWSQHNERKPPKNITIKTERYNQFDSNGPFIFGVHTNNYNSYKPAKVSIRGESVINATTQSTKYSSIVARRTPDQDKCNESGDVIPQDKKKDQKLSEKGPNRTKKDKRQTRSPKKHAEGIKCVLVGDGMVGKTNLIMSYLENRFTAEHVPTASDIYNCEVKVDDLPVQITICDTAGQDFFDPLRRLCYPDSDVFLLCFSVAKPKTFRSIQNKWAPTLSKSRASIVLVGTQADLRCDPKILTLLKNNHELPISKSEATDYASSIGAKYIETSSRANKGVKEAFDTAIWDALMTVKSRRAPPLWKRMLCLT